MGLLVSMDSNRRSSELSWLGMEPEAPVLSSSLLARSTGIHAGLGTACRDIRDI